MKKNHGKTYLQQIRFLRPSKRFLNIEFANSLIGDIIIFNIFLMEFGPNSEGVPDGLIMYSL